MRSDEAGARASVDTHHNAAQLRADTWNRLEYAIKRLVEAEAGRGADPEAARAAVASCLATLKPIERFWDFPGRERFQRLLDGFERGEYRRLGRDVEFLGRLLANDGYRTRIFGDVSADISAEEETSSGSPSDRHYFAVLFVDELSEQEELELRRTMRALDEPGDGMRYELVVVPSLEDALIAVMFNHNIQACVIRYDFPLRSATPLKALRHYIRVAEERIDVGPEVNRGVVLGELIHELRPELDLYLVTDIAPERVAAREARFFRRVFHGQEDYMELHLAIEQGVRERFRTPFFSALVDYSHRPAGIFHALPISRGNSIFKSHWIRDMGDFYGKNIFLAETSSTGGGLDSLLQPTGPLKQAQEAAARAFGARRTFFVTNGTSTANKIVVQALVRPGDVVLVDRDCHKSHHYGMVLSGARPLYLNAYPLERYGFYGAVPLEEIKRRLLSLRRAGRLEQVKMLLLTNCTFDGLVYDVERVMEEVLAIHPRIVILWDEAWFGFARCTPTYRRRTAMHAAAALRARFESAEYREEYARWREQFAELDPKRDETWLERRLLPDPDRVRIRVYATQSIHKSLTSLRQGSMVHVYDEDFARESEASFMEAYMTHTSTSPNYQVLASLDVGRRQVELEGFELVQKSVENAMTLRQQVRAHPLLSKYFEALGPSELIPRSYRSSGVESGYDPEAGWDTVDRAWREDEFVLDPTRVTLDISRTGIDGTTFRDRYLMQQFGIQVNKTSLNTVLFMTNIGTTRSAVAYLLEVLIRIAEQLEESDAARGARERELHELCVHRLTADLPPLPHFSHFHPCFRSGEGTEEGDIREAYFLAYDEDRCEYLRIDDDSIDKALAQGRELVSAKFVTPYPPGHPILVPGQVLTEEIVSFLRKLDTKEIHGYRPELGLQLFSEDALAEYAGSRGLDLQRAE